MDQNLVRDGGPGKSAWTLSAQRSEVPRQPLSQLTSLRFFAATVVVVFHLSFSWNGWPKPSSFLQGLTCGGYAAVSFFFVLSGYILYQAYPAANSTPKGFSLPFWRRRFARIAPVYLFGLLIAFPFVLDDLLRNGMTWSQALGLGSVLLLLQSWWPPFALLWNPPAWSLSVESFFYLMFPWLRHCAGRASRPILFTTVYALLLTTTMLRRDALSLTDLDHFNSTIAFQYYFPLIHLPQFFFGMVLAECRRAGCFNFPGYLCSIVFSLSVVSVILIFGFMYCLPWWTRSEAVLAPLFGLVVISASGNGPFLRHLAAPRLVLLGEASYSLYILHVPLLMWWGEYFRIGEQSVIAKLAGKALFFVVATFFSVVTYTYIEKPLRRWIIRT